VKYYERSLTLLMVSKIIVFPKPWGVSTQTPILRALVFWKINSINTIRCMKLWGAIKKESRRVSLMVKKIKLIVSGGKGRGGLFCIDVLRREKCSSVTGIPYEWCRCLLYLCKLRSLSELWLSPPVLNVHRWSARSWDARAKIFFEIQSQSGKLGHTIKLDGVA